MKKLLLSVAVILGFLLYSAYERSNGSLSEAAANPTPYLTPKSSSSQPSSASVSSQPVTNGQYKDGTFIGSVEDAFYGNVQVRAVIQSGKISNIDFLQYPNDRSTSVMINSQATPLLASEAIQAQNASVDIVSGATDTSNAFIRSLTSALSQAQ